MFEITRSTLTLFGFTLRWYGVLIALGVLGAVLLAMRREKTLKLPKDTAVNITLIGVPVGILCARIYYVLFSWNYYAAHPGDIFNIRQGGLAIYGGVIGGVLAGLIYARVKRIRFLDLADLAAPSLALGQAVGRWGNFLNQEAFGEAVTRPSLQFFPVSVYIEGSGWHYAAFFYESLWCALIVALLLTAERKHAFHKSGDSFFSYLYLYALERALVEGLRTDSLYLGPIRVSQLLSLAAALVIALLLCRRAARLSPVVRILPAFAVCLTGVAAALNQAILSVVFALAALGFAIAVYTAGEPARKE